MLSLYSYILKLYGWSSDSVYLLWNHDSNILEKVSYVKELDNSMINLIEDEAKLIQVDEEVTEFPIFCKEKLRFITWFIDIHTQKEDTLTGTADETIVGLKITKENYLIALNLLKERFNNLLDSCDSKHAPKWGRKKHLIETVN